VDVIVAVGVDVGGICVVVGVAVDVSVGVGVDVTPVVGVVVGGSIHPAAVKLSV